MNTFDQDPREAAIWIPGSAVVTQPESHRPGLPGEQELILHTMNQVKANRRRRTGLLERLKVITRGATISAK
ncbi:MAG TPA: hypothetical protein VK020_15685 [Microlunatus sp.]|nr:hypothetical protein [Microlunatus sp.]